MQFGLSTATALPPRSTQSGRSAADYVLRTCTVAEASGFDGVGIGHRYMGGDTHQYLQPLIAASHILARFPGLLVSTNIYLLPYGNPLRVAEEVATLDLLAPDRFIFGVGQGYRKDEAAAFSISKGERGRRTREGIEVMRELWQPGPRSYSGEFWQFDSVNLSAKPTRPTGPPIMLGADTLPTIAKVPERGGDYWYSSPRHSRSFLRRAIPVWRRAQAEAGRSDSRVAMGRNICIAENRQAALKRAEASFGAYMRGQAAWGQPGEQYDIDMTQLLQDRVILGTPEDAAQQIIELHDEFNVGYLNLRVYAVGMDQQQALEDVQQIGEEVLPGVRASTGSTPFIGGTPGPNPAALPGPGYLRGHEGSRSASPAS